MSITKEEGREGGGSQKCWAEVVHEAESQVKACMAKYDPSHDWAHVHRVRCMALRIAKSVTPNPDLKVVEIAALFHDVADAKYTTQPISEILKPFFSVCSGQLTEEQMALVERIIPCISYSTEKKLRSKGQWTEWHNTCIELHCVQDADRLDAMGGIGVMRCAGYSCVKGRKLLKGPSNGESDDSDNDGSAEEHFYEKLLLLKDLMKTGPGKEEAAMRHETMLANLAALDRERRFWEGVIA